MTRHLSAVPEMPEPVNRTEPVPDRLHPSHLAQAGARTVARKDVVAALELLGLSPRYVDSITFEDNALWVRSLLPGRTGGLQVAQRLDLLDPLYTDVLPIDWAGETEIPDDIDVLNSDGDGA
ncbi:MAG: hypothetical protein P1U38_09695 [Aeromicrobium sp.]|uniref:hypothetical protein n=1 Tax=Aeromicrobium sp. TaxID=1871063 RepID=UPI002638838B|nr:hypothetical protein [Aeromicrobium sp.]MDF1705034.1 hypothetical protein [Aeromicrobium sp.]